MRILLASRNPGKLREVRAIMAPHGIEVDEAPAEWVPPEETGDTYEENALLKARSLAEFVRLPALADDSGIEVYALENKPGVRSARYAGENATDEENLQKLVDAMREVPEGLRGARYRCVAVLVTPDGRSAVAEGTFEGCIVLEPRGSHGFGYDPIFGVAGDDRTAAEMSPEEKDAKSHRGQAFTALAPAVRTLLSS